MSLLPSPLKSPVPTIVQVPGTFATNEVAGFKTVVPFISQIATLPLVSCHRMSLLPSPLKSPVPTIVQVPATFATNEVAGFKTVVPFISQIATLPLVSRHRMSLLPSPLKSWVAVSSARHVVRTVIATPADGIPAPTAYIVLAPSSVALATVKLVCTAALGAIDLVLWLNVLA